MTDILYKVGVQLETTGDLGGKLDGINNSANKLTGSLGRMTGNLTNAFTGAIESAVTLGAHFAMWGTTALVGAIAGVTALNSQLELSTIGIADLLNSNNMTSGFTDGMDQASKLMTKMRQDAAALPGEFKDLERIFQMSAVSGLKHGQSVQDIEKLSSRAMAYGIGAAGINGPMIARELSAILEGHSTSANVFSRKLGLDSKAVNKMTYADRFTEVSKQLAKHDDAIPYYEQSFQGLWTSLVDKGKLFITNTTAPLFDSIKTTLHHVLGWLGTHEAQVKNFSETLGHFISNAWDTSVHKLELWGPKMLDYAISFKDNLISAFHTIAPIAEMIFNHLKETAALYGMLKIGGTVLAAGGGGPIMSLLSSFGLSLPVVAAAFAVVGAQVLMMKGAIENTKEGADHASAALFNLSRSGHVLLDGYNKVANSNVNKITDAIGNNALGNLESQAGIVAELFEAVGTKLKDFWNTVDSILHPLSHRDSATNKTPTGFASEKASVKGKKLHWDKQHLLTPKESEEKNKLLNGNGATIIAKIEINVEQTGDPERVARAVMDKLVNIKKFKTSSPFATNFSAVPK